MHEPPELVVTETNIRERLASYKKKQNRLATWKEIEFLLEMVDDLRKQEPKPPPRRTTIVCPYCGMSTWFVDRCCLPGCDGYAPAQITEHRED